MIFKSKKHTNDLYNTLLILSRNILFYKKMKLSDNFETRIYLMFIHFSIMMIVFKKKGQKFNQKSYDSLFNNIEYDLRELGFGDVTVNKKMKDLNKLLYDILLKINLSDKQDFKMNKSLIFKYFKVLKDLKEEKYNEFEVYFNEFYKFCFELPLENVIRDSVNFNKFYGST